VIHFESTLFTSEGVDILYRQKVLDPALETEITNKMKQNPVTKPFVASLFAPKRTDI